MASHSRVSAWYGPKSWVGGACYADPMIRGVLVIGTACCLLAQGNNGQTFGLTAEDHSEVARLNLTPTFASLGGLLFQAVQIVRERASAYRGMDRGMAECVIRGGSPASCAAGGRAANGRLLVEHDEAKGVVLRTCEDAKTVPEKLVETYGYGQADVDSARELLLKMFGAAGVECAIPTARAAQPRPAANTGLFGTAIQSSAQPRPTGNMDPYGMANQGLNARSAEISIAKGSFWERVWGGEAEHKAWVKEDLMAYIAAGRRNFEGYKKGPSFLNEDGHKSWQSNTKPAMAENCRVIQVDANQPNAFVCILARHSDLALLRKDYERFVGYVREAVPVDWLFIPNAIGGVESTGWGSSSGLSGEVYILADSSKNDYTLSYQITGLQPVAKLVAPVKQVPKPVQSSKPVVRNGKPAAK